MTGRAGRKMEDRVLVTGAGTGASNNFIQSLRAGDRCPFIVGCHDDRFVLKKSVADRNCVVPEATHPDLLTGLSRVVTTERIDLLIPTSDADVRLASTLRDKLPCRVFLPHPTV